MTTTTTTTTTTTPTTYTCPKPTFICSSSTTTSTDIVKDMPVYKLNSGYNMPVLGYGTFRSTPGEVGPALKKALEVGYRHLDFAHVYGNEKEIGQVLKQAFDDGLVKRDELFITGKLWNTDHDVNIVSKACDVSLKDLQINYFDLYLIHFPICNKHTGLHTPSFSALELGTTPLIDTWRAMEDLVEKGKCRSIGVSNYSLIDMHDLVNQAKIMPACNQIEVHPYYVRESLVNYCLSRHICVTAHTPLGGGLLNKTTWKSVETPMESNVIQDMASAKSKTPAQIMLRWILQRGCTVAVKSIKDIRIEENINVFDFNLSDDEMKQITLLDKYKSYKTNLNPLGGFIGGPDCFTEDGTDIFD